MQGLFYIGSALALVSALITFLFVPNIKADAMRDEAKLVEEQAEARAKAVRDAGEAKASAALAK